MIQARPVFEPFIQSGKDHRRPLIRRAQHYEAVYLPFAIQLLDVYSGDNSAHAMSQNVHLLRSQLIDYIAKPSGILKIAQPPVIVKSNNFFVLVALRLEEI